MPKVTPNARSPFPAQVEQPTEAEAKAQLEATKRTQAAGELWTKTTKSGTVDVSGAPIHTPTEAELAATAPNPVKTAIQENITRTTTRLEQALGHDAMSIARGRKPTHEGDPLSADQLKEVRDTLQAFVKDMPIGAFAPEMATRVQTKLEQAGIEVRDLNTARLRDLGPVGREIAKDLLKDLREDSPAAAYSVVAGAAAAIGYMGYTGGSERLERYGIKPRASTRLLDDRLKLEVSGEWQSRFKDFKPTVGATYTYKTSNWELSSTIGRQFTEGDDPMTFGLRARYASPHLAGFGYLNASRRGPVDAGLQVAYHPSEQFSLSAAVHHDFIADRTTASAEAAWEIRKNVDFALSASHDSRGDSRVGAGLRIRW